MTNPDSSKKQNESEQGSAIQLKVLLVVITLGILMLITKAIGIF